MLDWRIDVISAVACFTTTSRVNFALLLFSYPVVSGGEAKNVTIYFRRAVADFEQTLPLFSLRFVIANWTALK